MDMRLEENEDLSEIDFPTCKGEEGTRRGENIRT